MSRTIKLKPRRRCFRGCNWCTSNRAASRSADASTREALKNAHDADAMGALHPAEVRLIDRDAQDAAERESA